MEADNQDKGNAEQKGANEGPDGGDGETEDQMEGLGKSNIQNQVSPEVEEEGNDPVETGENQDLDEDDQELYRKYQELYQKYQEQYREFEEEYGDTDDQTEENGEITDEEQYRQYMEQLGNDEEQESEEGEQSGQGDEPVRKIEVPYVYGGEQYRESMQMGAIIQDALKEETSEQEEDSSNKVKIKKKKRVIGLKTYEIDDANSDDSEDSPDATEPEEFDPESSQTGAEQYDPYSGMVIPENYDPYTGMVGGVEFDEDAGTADAEQQYRDGIRFDETAQMKMEPEALEEYEAALRLQNMDQEVMFDDVQIDDDNDDTIDNLDFEKRQEMMAAQESGNGSQSENLDTSVDMDEVDKAIMESLQKYQKLPDPLPNIEPDKVPDEGPDSDVVKENKTEKGNDSGTTETVQTIKIRSNSLEGAMANLKAISINSQNREILDSFKNKNWSPIGGLPLKPKQPKRFGCEICGAAFAKKNNLQKHQKIHTNEKPFQCEVCQAKFTTKSNLAAHNRLHTGEKPYKCEICDAAFSQRGNLTKHNSIHTGEKPYKCYFCEAAFSDRGSMKSHIMFHMGEKPFKCDQCKAEFTVESKLIKHQRMHTGERPYKCTICDAAFIHKTSFTKHMKRKVHDGDTPFKCEYCDLELTSQVRLANHLRTHTEEKPFKCDSCHATFSMKCSLTIHQRIHTGVKPFKCDSCDATFSQRGSLTVHQRIHSGEKPFQCPICDATFFQKGAMGVHMKLHTQQIEESGLESVFGHYLIRGMPNINDPEGSETQEQEKPKKKRRPRKTKAEKLAEERERQKAMQEEIQSKENPDLPKKPGIEGNKEIEEDFLKIFPVDKNALDQNVTENMPNEETNELDESQGNVPGGVETNGIMNYGNVNIKQEIIDGEVKKRSYKKKKKDPNDMSDPPVKKERKKRDPDAPKRKYVKKKDLMKMMALQQTIKQEPLEDQVNGTVVPEMDTHKMPTAPVENAVNLNIENQKTDHIQSQENHTPINQMNDHNENQRPDPVENHSTITNAKIHEFQGQSHVQSHDKNQHIDRNRVSTIMENHVVDMSKPVELPSVSKSEPLGSDNKKRSYDNIEHHNTSNTENNILDYSAAMQSFSNKRAKYDDNVATSFHEKKNKYEDNVLPSIHDKKIKYEDSVPQNFHVNARPSGDNLDTKRADHTPENWQFYGASNSAIPKFESNINQRFPMVDNFGFHTAPPTSQTSSNGDTKRMNPGMEADYWRFYANNMPRFDPTASSQAYQSGENPSLYTAPHWGMYPSQNMRIDSPASQRAHSGLNYGLSTADSWGLYPSNFPRLDMGTGQQFHPSDSQRFHTSEFQRFPGGENPMMAHTQNWDFYTGKPSMFAGGLGQQFGVSDKQKYEQGENASHAAERAASFKT